MKNILFALLLLCTTLQAHPPDTLRIDNYTLVLDAYVYKNLMPIVGGSDTRLRAVIWLKDINHLALKGVEARAIHVFSRDDVWSVYNASGPHYAVTGGPEYTIIERGLEYTIRGGPDWRVGTWVNVAFEFQYKGTYYVIGKPCVKIEEVH